MHTQQTSKRYEELIIRFLFAFEDDIQYVIKILVNQPLQNKYVE